MVKIPSARSAGLVAMTLVMAAAVAQARELSRCDFSGRFARIVAETVGPERVALSSYMALVVRADGTEVCTDGVNADLAVTPASTVKVLVAIALLRRLDSREIKLSRLVTIDQPNAAIDCKDSSCAVYGPGKRLRVRRLLRDMIVVSNNVATNQLIDLVGKDFIADTAQRLGAAALQIRRKLYSRAPAEPEITTPNSGTARALAAVYRELATGRLGVISKTSRRLLLRLLGQPRVRPRLSAAFPPSVRFFHKHGNTSEVSGDAGFYWLGRRTAVIIVALQSFVDYKTLRTVGRRTLALMRTLGARRPR
jgi:beta-lactamase class A